MWKRMGASAACMCVLTTSVHGGGGSDAPFLLESTETGKWASKQPCKMCVFGERGRNSGGGSQR